MSLELHSEKDYESLLNNEYPFILKTRNEILESFSSTLLPVIKETLAHELDFISNLRKEIIDHYSDPKVGANSLQDEIASRDRLLVLIATVWLAPEPIDFDARYTTFYESLDSFIQRTEPERHEIQLKERFLRQPGDRFILRIRKSFKRFFHRISTLPRRFRNLFFKTKLPITYWRHAIPYRNLVDYHYRGQLIRQLKDIAEVFHKKFAAFYLALKLAEEKQFIRDKGTAPDLSVFESPTKEELEKSLLDEVEHQLDEVVKKSTENLIDDYQKAGTIELPARKFKDSKVKKELAGALKAWSKNNFNWENTLFVLFEEWRADLELYRLQYQSQDSLADLKSEQQQRLEEQVVTKVDLIKQFIIEAKDTLESGKDTGSMRLKKVLIQARKQLDKRLVPSLTEAVSSKNFLNLINSLEHEARVNIESISDDHVISKTITYDAPLAPNELYTTSPYELIAFELLSKFEDQLEKIKNQLFLEIEKANAVFRDIDHVIIFSVSSAISVLEDSASKETEALDIALDGIGRAGNRLDEGLELLTNALDTSTSALQETIDRFGQNLLELTDNDSVFELKVRITKARTLQQAEEVREKIIQRVLGSKDRLVVLVKNYAVKFNQAFQQARARFILTAKTQELSREISDFLLESQSAMDKLPTIYRQLYKIEPLTDLELFEGRQEEIEKFNASITNWEKGRFASTIIIGEKWGGQTSLINYIVKSKRLNYPILRQVLPKNIRTADDFFYYIKVLINRPEISTKEALIEELNDGRKRIIIIEDLQNVFIRKVGGFDALNFLFDLISQTSTNVFWVSSTTLHTWSYLEKTVKIHEYFSYAIEMGLFSNEQIKEIIWKRNSISGFQIRFEPDQAHLDNKKFKRLTKEEQQKALEAEFFKSLCDFAKSNVSMALLFWLLSTHSVDSRQITIGVFKRPNLNFLSALSAEKIQILYALILHDGLSETEISEVQNISPNLARMLLLSLVEDSIIIEREEINSLNPLIYRDAISILKTKNLIQ